MYISTRNTQVDLRSLMKRMDQRLTQKLTWSVLRDSSIFAKRNIIGGTKFRTFKNFY